MFSDVTNDWNKLGSESERDRKYEQNVANLKRIAEKSLGAVFSNPQVKFFWGTRGQIL